MESKKCTKCGVEKSLCDFYDGKKRKDGMRKKIAACKQCTLRKNAKWIEENKENHCQSKKKWLAENKDRVKQWHKKHYQENKDKYQKQQKEYYVKNKKKHRRWMNEYEKKRYSEDPIFRTMKNLRDQMRRLGDYKNDSTIKIVGCSPKEFWKMNGSPSSEELKSLHIDHIIPLSWFDMTNEDHVRVASHHTNLQYLTADDNWAKSDTYAGSPNNIIAYKEDFDIEAHVEKMR